MGACGCIFVEGHKNLSPTRAKRFGMWGVMTETTRELMETNGKSPVDFSRGRCHWSYDEYRYKCAEFGDANLPNKVSNVRTHVLSGYTPR